MCHNFSENFELLELSPGASLSEVKLAYRELSQIWHPDRFIHNKKLEKRAIEHCKVLNTAYQELCDNWQEVEEWVSSQALKSNSHKSPCTKKANVNPSVHTPPQRFSPVVSSALFFLVVLLLSLIALPSKASFRTITPSSSSNGSSLYTNAGIVSDPESLPEISKLAINCEIKKLGLNIRNGDDLEALDSDGNTALIWATRSNCVKAAKILVESGASLAIKANNGFTALDWAKDSGNTEIAELLQEAALSD